MRWCLPHFDNGETDLFTWQAQYMSNYLCHLLTKQLDVPTNLEKPEKRFVPWYFHSILKEGEDDNNEKIGIKPHHVEWLYCVMMAWMLQGGASIAQIGIVQEAGSNTTYQPLIVYLTIVYKI